MPLSRRAPSLVWLLAGGWCLVLVLRAAVAHHETAWCRRWRMRFARPPLHDSSFPNDDVGSVTYDEEKCWIR